MTKKYRYTLIITSAAIICFVVYKNCYSNIQKITPVTYNKAQIEQLTGFEKHKEDFKERNILFKKVAEIKSLSAELYNCFGGGWETEPGDFRRIKILLKNGHIIEYDNINGWIKFLEKSEPLSTVISQLVKTPIQSKKIHKHLYGVTLDRKGEDKILALFGYPYGSDPGLVTLIYVTPYNAEIIFNRNFDLFEIREHEQAYSLVGRIGSEESYADPYEIAIKNGKLTFEKLPLQKVYEGQDPHIVLHNSIGWSYDKQPGEFTRLEIATPPKSKDPKNQVFNVASYEDTWTPFLTPIKLPIHTTTIKQTPYFIILENQIGRIIILNGKNDKESTPACLTILRSAPYYPTSLFNGYFSLQEITEDDTAYHLLGTRKDAEDPHKLYEITINKADMSEVECNW